MQVATLSGAKLGEGVHVRQDVGVHPDQATPPNPPTVGDTQLPQAPASPPGKEAVRRGRHEMWTSAWKNLLISMALIGSVVLLIVTVSPRPAQMPTPTVDAQAVATEAARSGVQVLTASRVPSLAASSVRFMPVGKGQGAWTVGYLGEGQGVEQKHLGIEQISADTEAAQAWRAQREHAGTPVATLSGAGAQWALRAEGDGMGRWVAHANAPVQGMWSVLRFRNYAQHECESIIATLTVTQPVS